MVKKGKLFAALDAHQGKDHKAEKEKKKQKHAVKEKKQKRERRQEEEGEKEEVVDGGGVKINGSGVTGDGVESEDEDEESDGPVMLDAAQLDDSDMTNSDSDDGDEDKAEEEEEEEEEEDDENASDSESIALSDLSSLSQTEQEDLLPHQRLTINNHAALNASLRRIALPLATLPFSEHQSITSSEPTASSIPSIDDDLARELAFYKQSLDAAVEARSHLIKEGIPFSRPTDYFAEMVKTDEHMGKVKQKLVDAAAGKKAAAEARRQRDLKKFGKQVQVAKLQERDKAKRETLDKIQLLKRKRQQSGAENTNEADLFDVALDDATASNTAKNAGRRDRGGGDARGRGSGRGRGGDGPSSKRQKRDDRYGHGGKKRFAKSGDAISSGDLSGFSAKGMKRGGSASGRRGGGAAGGAARGGSKRLGKSRRVNSR